MTKNPVKIYTKTGDKGKTGLFTGQRVPKSDPRVEAYGTVDELSSFLGLLKTALDTHQNQKIRDELVSIQKDLLSIGAQLACYPDRPTTGMVPLLSPHRTGELEHSIDDMEASLEPLVHFIFPGGHLTAALAHVCRTICRRAERRIVEMALSFGKEPGEDPQLVPIMEYVNRLSDYLFTLARYCNMIFQHRDEIGKPVR